MSNTAPLAGFGCARPHRGPTSDKSDGSPCVNRTRNESHNLPVVTRLSSPTLAYALVPTGRVCFARFVTPIVPSLPRRRRTLPRNSARSRQRDRASRSFFAAAEGRRKEVLLSKPRRLLLDPRIRDAGLALAIARSRRPGGGIGAGAASWGYCGEFGTCKASVLESCPCLIAFHLGCDWNPSPKAGVARSRSRCLIGFEYRLAAVRSESCICRSS